MVTSPLLSKSTFLKGDQCAKLLYLSVHQKALKTPPSDQQLAIFEAGNEVGTLARDLFPGGINCKPNEETDLATQLEITKQAIQQGATVLYEAAFCEDDVFVAVDILVKKGNTWNAYEVKSTTSVKNNHIKDVAIQYYVLQKAGLPVHRFMLLHINNKYIRADKLNLKKLFKAVNVLPKAKGQQAAIPDKIRLFKSILTSSKSPAVPIGPQCKSPYPCPFIAHCWQHVPSPSVMDLTHAGKKAWDWWNKGIKHLRDLPKSEGLSKSQSMQVDVERSGKPHVDVKGIRMFLNNLTYPLMHLDFETVNPAIPKFKGTHPFQALVFQYSLHIESSPGAVVEHKEFLAPETEDPRLPVLKQLLIDTEGMGDILVYNIHFERAILANLAHTYPEFSNAIQQRISRLKDLMAPFSERLYLDPDMNGLTSIKSVLPALVPEMSYDHLEIKEGGTASLTYLQLMSPSFKGDKNAVRSALKAYCEMDTLAMVKILDKLRSSVTISP